MAGLKKRNNTWFASYYVNGKRVIKTTKIEVSPSAILPGKTKSKMEAELKLNAQIIANELEKAAKGEKANTEIVHAVAGSSKAKALLKGKAHMQGVEDFLKDWLKSRTEKGAVDRDGKAVRQFLCYLDDRKTLPLDAVTPHHAEEFMAKELERVSSGTVKRYLESLTCAFNSAVSKRIITINPFKGFLVLLPVQCIRKPCPQNSARHRMPEKRSRINVVGKGFQSGGTTGQNIFYPGSNQQGILGGVPQCQFYPSLSKGIKSRPRIHGDIPGDGGDQIAGTFSYG